MTAPRARTVRLPTGQTIALSELRRLIREQRPTPPEQPTLFELHTDARPRGERTAAERYAAPSLFSYAESPETRLRAMWTDQGVTQERQDAMIADITAKAQPGARVGPFTIPHRLNEE